MLSQINKIDTLLAADLHLLDKCESSGLVITYFQWEVAMLSCTFFLLIFLLVLPAFSFSHLLRTKTNRLPI